MLDKPLTYFDILNEIKNQDIKKGPLKYRPHDGFFILSYTR